MDWRCCVELQFSRDVFAEPDDARLTRRLTSLVGPDLSEEEVKELARGDLGQVRKLAVPAQQAVMALVKPDKTVRGRKVLGELEKIVGTTVDYVGIAFLTRAQAASDAVVRVVTRERAPVGTGVIVSKDLLLTNHHVTGDELEAQSQLIQFRYQLGPDDAPAAITEFQLDPDRFFYTSPESKLDFSLLAVGSRLSGNGEFGSFGFIPLSSASDRHAEGDFVTLVEHPEGMYKQIALRENRVIGRGKGGTTLHYGADTLGGSSGSPVFNDQFELVALHHAGGAHNETLLDTGKRVPSQSNEGIRISAIVTQLQRQLRRLAGDQRDLLAAALDPSTRGPTRNGPGSESAGPPPVAALATPIADGSHRKQVELLLPITLDIGIRTPRIDAQVTAAASAPLNVDALPHPRGGEGLERNRPPDPNYANRHGYSDTFLGSMHRIPLPKLRPVIRDLAAEVDGGGSVLRYLHFSSVHNAQRKLPFFTAVNIDGARAPKGIDRKTGEIDWGEGVEGAETWYRDKRVLLEQQLGDEFYGQQKFRMFDRGHMVRRLDPAWGSESTLLKAADDTFHFTNCCPQAWQFNEQIAFWAGIEDYALANAKAAKSRITVFSGPIYTDQDPVFWGVKVPKAFWKILVRIDPQLGPRATGFIADQTNRLDEGENKLEAAYTGDWSDINKVKQYTAAIKTIARRTDLDFGTLTKYDSYSPTESLEPQEITSFEDVRL